MTVYLPAQNIRTNVTLVVSSIRYADQHIDFEGTTSVVEAVSHKQTFICTNTMHPLQQPVSLSEMRARCFQRVRVEIVQQVGARRAVIVQHG